MIKDRLIPALVEKYGEHRFQIGSPPNPIATFPAVHPEIGDLIIYDHGSEATVYVGNFTHSHFNPYDSALSQDEIDEIVTEDVLGFLEELFSDRVLLWKANEGFGGGWERNFVGKVPSAQSHISYFVWSGLCEIEEVEQAANQNIEDVTAAHPIINELSSLTLTEAQELVQRIEQAFGSSPEINLEER
jgi:hypothetical protein